MKIIRYRLAWVVLGVLFVCAIGVARWRELSWTSDAIRHARDGLQTTVESEASLEKVASSRVEEFRRHQFDALREAIRRIDSAPPLLPHPVPVFAFVRENGKGDVRVELSLQWVENGFSVTGIYTIDHAGRITECPDLFGSSGLSTKVRLRAGLRHVDVGIVANAADEDWWRSGIPGKEAPSYLASFPPGYFRQGDVRLGLLTKSGREPMTTVVRYWTRQDTLAGTDSGPGEPTP
jgi:hypothetical protein